MKMKARVGVLVDRLDCMPLLIDTINSLAKDGSIELHLLQNRHRKRKGYKENPEKIRNVGITRFISIAFFNIVVSIERRLLRVVSASIAKHFDKIRLDPDLFASVLVLSPTINKSKNLVSYGDEDIERIRGLGLDLILRGNGAGIYHGKIINVSKKGIISFHYGDNRWNRGGPLGFWEVYLQKPSTGFTIQILNEKIGDGDVIFRGETVTRKTYTQNVLSLFMVANPFMALIIIAYSTTGVLPKPYPKTPYSHPLLKTPRFYITLNYIAQITSFFASLIVRRKVLGRHQRWSVAFVKENWETSDLSRATVVKNPKGRYLADPFVITREDLTVIFVEDYNVFLRSGTISAIKILPDNSWEILSDVIKEDFHLSFPYLFEFGGDLFMIPESSEIGAIRLYKCIQFPDCWEYQYDLMRGVSAVDTMVFEFGDKFWLLSNMASKKESRSYEALYAYSSKSPLSKNWRSHPNNPICFSTKIGRNGGLLRDKDGMVFRVRQRQGFNQYGKAISIAKITKLDSNGYEELRFCDIEPNFLPGLNGTHHMHSNGKVTVFDFVKENTLD